MNALRHRVLGIALAPLVGLGVTFACVACGSKADPGVASADAPAASGSSGASGGGSWAAYDATMQSFVTCMHEHGKTGVRYEGHKDTARYFGDELSGMPDTGPVAAGAVGGPPPTDALTVCSRQAFGGRMAPDNRPQPYARATVSASERAKNQAFSRCMREHGFTDYPDPDPDEGVVMSFPPRYGSDNKMDSKEALPGLDAATKACYAQTGADPHEGG